MIIKNTGRKIIGFGQTSVLPEQTVTIPDTYKSTVLDTYVALGIVKVVNKTETKTGKAVKTTGKKIANDEVKTSDKDESREDEETVVGKE